MIEYFKSVPIMKDNFIYRMNMNKDNLDRLSFIPQSVKEL